MHFMTASYAVQSRCSFQSVYMLCVSKILQKLLVRKICESWFKHDIMLKIKVVRFC